jgi:hypothetical protein
VQKTWPPARRCRRLLPLCCDVSAEDLVLGVVACFDGGWFADLSCEFERRVYLFILASKLVNLGTLDLPIQ